MIRRFFSKPAATVAYFYFIDHTSSNWVFYWCIVCLNFRCFVCRITNSRRCTTFVCVCEINLTDPRPTMTSAHSFLEFRFMVVLWTTPHLCKILSVIDRWCDGLCKHDWFVHPHKSIENKLNFRDLHCAEPDNLYVFASLWSHLNVTLGEVFKPLNRSRFQVPIHHQAKCERNSFRYAITPHKPCLNRIYDQIA